MEHIDQMQQADHAKADKKSRYLQLLLLTIAGGAIYPMLYMRQIYQTTMLQAFQLTDGQLGELYAMLGLLFFLTYSPSGWLADRIKPMRLIAISLLGTGLLGLWYATLPSYGSLQIIFAGWGITTGLTFWGAVMKRIKLLSGNAETGKFYGFYDGGRGLVEAVLASVALFIFAKVAGDANENVVQALIYVIYMYSYLCMGLAALCVIAAFQEKKEITSATEKAEEAKKIAKGNLVADIISLLKVPEIWLIALIISAGYHLFWATYSFSAYLQEGNWGFTAVMAGMVTTLKLWMRPIGGALGGILGDKFTNIRVLNLSLIISALGLVALVVFPMSSFAPNIIVSACVFFILLVGLMTYAIRGLYWSIIKHLDVPENKLGLAIGLISTIGYCPDIFIPLINGYIMDFYKTSQQTGYQVYFGYTVFMTFLGIIGCFILKARTDRLEAASNVAK